MKKDASFLVRMPRTTLNALGESSQATGIARAEIMRRLLQAWLSGARIRGLPRNGNDRHADTSREPS